MVEEPITPQLYRWIILYRDNFTCQICGKKAKFSMGPWFGSNPKGAYCNLSVHHIFGRSHWELNEQITVCQDCHIHICHKGGYKIKNPLPFLFQPREVTDILINEAIEDKQSRIDDMAIRW